MHSILNKLITNQTITQSDIISDLKSSCDTIIENGLSCELCPVGVNYGGLRNKDNCTCIGDGAEMDRDIILHHSGVDYTGTKVKKNKGKICLYKNSLIGDDCMKCPFHTKNDMSTVTCRIPITTEIKVTFKNIAKAYTDVSRWCIINYEIHGKIVTDESIILSRHPKHTLTKKDLIEMYGIYNVKKNKEGVSKLFYTGYIKVEPYEM